MTFNMVLKLLMMIVLCFFFGFRPMSFNTVVKQKLNLKFIYGRLLKRLREQFTKLIGD